MFRFVALVLLFGALWSAARAEIVPAEESLESGPSSTLRWHEKTSAGFLSDPMPPQVAAIVGDVGGAYADVWVVASKSVDAKVLANALLKMEPGGRVEFSTGKKWSVAHWNRSIAKFGQESANHTLDFQPARQALVDAGFKPVAILRSPRHTQWSPTLTEGPEPLRNTKMAVLGESAEWKIVASASGTMVPVAAAFALFLAPPLLIGIGFLLARQVAMDTSKPVEDRKRQFKKIANFSIFGVMGVSIPLAFFLIFSNQVTPVLDLWMGTRRSTAMVPLVILPLLTMLPFLPMIAKAESRIDGELHGYDPEAPVVEPTTLTGGGPIPWKFVLALRLIPLGLIVSSFLIPKDSLPFPPRYLVTAGVVLYAVLVHSTSAIYRKIRGTPAATARQDLQHGDQELLDRIQAVATKVNAPLDDVTINENQLEGQVLCAAYLDRKLTVPRRMARDLTDDEFNFGLAHSLLEGNGSEFWKMLLLILGVTIPITLIFVFLRPFGIPFPLVVLAPMPIMFPAMLWMMKRSRILPVAKALEAYPNEAAASSYFAKYWATNPLAKGKTNLWEDFVADREKKRARSKS